MDNCLNTVKKRRLEPERNEYLEASEWIANFLDNESAPRSRPDVTEWRLQRGLTIHTLDEFREKLDALCASPNSGNSGGNTAEIGSIGCSVIENIKSLCGVRTGLRSFIGNTLTSIPMVSSVGKMIQYTGTCIGGVSTTMTSRISAKCLQEIEEILEEDLKLSRPLEEWLSFSKELDSNIQTVFGVSLTSAKFNTIIKIFRDFLKFSKTDNDFDTIVELLKQKYSVYIGKDVEVGKLRKFHQYLSASPQFADRMRRILSFSSVKLEDIQLFLDGVRMYESIIGISGSSHVPSPQGIPQVPDAEKVPVFSIFQTIRLALNVISLINPASVGRHGASKYSDALNHLVSSLDWELKRIENL